MSLSFLVADVGRLFNFLGLEDFLVGVVVVVVARRCLDVIGDEFLP